jgi:glycosyltransferase involved in cell wall biosynthesis
MKIAIVTTYPPGTGSLNEYAYHFVRYLKEKAEVESLHLLVDDLPDGGAYPPQDGVTIVPCWKFNSLSSSSRIVRAVRSIKPDIVLFNVQFASFGNSKVAASLGLMSTSAVRRLGFPTVVLLHNIMETVDLKGAGFGANPIVERGIRLVGNAVTRLLLSADMVTVTIPKYVELLEAKYRVGNVVLAPHGSFEDAPLPSLDLPPGPRQIMTFGKFGTYKRVDVLLQAYELLLKQGMENISLVIAGSDSPNAAGYLAGTREHFAHLPSVTYTGYVAEEDVPRIFGEAAVVIFPYTHTTGSSGVLHQAGDYGKAVVLPNLGDLAEVVTEEGYTGAFFTPDNAESLAEQIRLVLDNDAYRREMATQNLMAARGLPIDDVVDWYLIHFEEILRKRTNRQLTGTKRGTLRMGDPRPARGERR